MIRARLCPPFAVLLTSMLAAADFAPIPASDWAVRTGTKGAVILEDRTRWDGRTVFHLYRARIFARNGQDAAEIEDLPQGAYEIAGRTVYPDGHSVVINKRTDFATKAASLGNDAAKATHLVAPGITPDCIFELSWRESADGPYGGLPKRFESGLYFHEVLPNPYPTRICSLELPLVMGLPWSLNPGSGPAPKVEENSRTRIITFTDLPALEVPPFALRPTLNLPSITVFWSPENMYRGWRRDPEAFWSHGPELYYKPYYEERIDKGGAFKALAAQLTAGLPKKPAEAAVELLMRLDGAVANVSYPTFAEKAALPKNFWKDYDVKDLTKAAKTRRTSADGMRLLYYHLLKEAGIKPSILMVCDRQTDFFSWQFTNLWQFSAEFIGVPREEGGFLWLDPSARYLTPGIIRPRYSGVPGLLLDTATWKGAKGFSPELVTPMNAEHFAYSLDLGEDADRLRIEAHFAGYPEYDQRSRFLALDEPGQTKELKETFEGRLKNLKVESAAVQGATDPKKNLSWTLAGTLEHEDTRVRKIDPFPGMTWPVAVSGTVEDQRTVPIVLNYTDNYTALCTFKVPEGFGVAPRQDFTHENTFGQTSWIEAYDPATRQVTVRFKVEIRRVVAPASAWADFRTFLGWVEEACRAQVVLTREAR